MVKPKLTLILPGFSLKNKAWAEEIQKGLSLIFPTSIVNWAHWETGKTEANWIEKEAEKIIYSLQGEQVNIVAKSIGTAVAMVVLRLKPESINKIILCGVPICDFLKGDEKYYEPLRKYQSDKILCIQNKDDNHGSYDNVEKFLHSLNPNLKTISQPRSDHEYPYLDKFIDFLSK